MVGARGPRLSCACEEGGREHCAEMSQVRNGYGATRDQARAESGAGILGLFRFSELPRGAEGLLNACALVCPAAPNGV